MRIPALALLVCGPLVAALAHAAPSVPSVVPPARVQVGQEYETAVPDLPLDVEEFELFLRPEDGPGRLIQLTREHDAGERALRWRMPRIACARARLVLRAGGRFGESESEASVAFTIEPPQALELSELLRGEDETAWRFRDAVTMPAALLLPPGAAAFARVEGALGATVPSRADGPRPSASESSRFEPGRLASSPQGTAPTHARRPARVPLRI